MYVRDSKHGRRIPGLAKTVVSHSSKRGRRTATVLKAGTQDERKRKNADERAARIEGEYTMFIASLVH